VTEFRWRASPIVAGPCTRVADTRQRRRQEACDRVDARRQFDRRFPAGTFPIVPRNSSIRDRFALVFTRSLQILLSNALGTAVALYIHDREQ
jgi:hypothetical protein